MYYYKHMLHARMVPCTGTLYPMYSSLYTPMKNMVQTTDRGGNSTITEEASRFHALFPYQFGARKGVRSKLAPPAPMPIDRQQLPGSPIHGYSLTMRST